MPEERVDTSRINVVVDNRQAINKLGQQEAQYAQLSAEINNLTADVNKYNKAQAKLNSKNVNKQSKAYKNAQETVKRLQGSFDKYTQGQSDLKKLTGEIDKQRAAIGLQGQTLAQLERTQRRYTRELKNITEGTERYKKMRMELKAINKEVERQRKNLRATGVQSKEVNKVNRSFGGVRSTLTDLVGAGGKAGLYGAAAAGVALVVKEGLALEKQWTRMRRDVARLSDESGQSLSSITADVQAVAKTFDKDFTEVLNATNSLAKQMGIEFDEALKLIETGFIQGADVQGDFLSHIEQYPIQFKQAGLSAEEFIKVAIQQGIGGDFDDKLLDSVKEITLRLKELTPAAKAALAPLGGDFVAQITRDLNTGQKSIVQVFNEIIRKSKELGLTTQETQALIADLGGGPLEDLGGLERAFDQLDSAMNRNLSTTDSLGKAQKESLEIQKEVQAELEQLSRAFEGAGETLQNTLNRYIAFSLRNLNSLVNSISKLTTGIDTSLTQQERLIQQLPELRKQYDELSAAIVKDEKLIADFGTTQGLRAEAATRRIARRKKELKELIPILTEAEDANIKFTEQQRDAIAKNIEGTTIQITTEEQLTKELETQADANSRLREQEKLRREEARKQRQIDKFESDKIEGLGGLETATPGISEEETEEIIRERRTSEEIRRQREIRLQLIRDYNEQVKQLELENASTESERIELQRQLELQATQEQFDKLIEIAQMYNLDTTKLFEERSKQIANINKNANEATKAEEDRVFAARLASAQSFANSLGSIANSLTELGVKNQGFQKALALTQVGIDTALAISGAIRAASQSAGNPIQLIAQIATGIATVLSNFARVKTILSSSKTPEPPKLQDGGILRGPRHSAGGIPTFVKSTGSMVEVEGGEFVVNREATAKNNSLLRFINADRGRNSYSIVPTYQGGGQIINPRAAHYIKGSRLQDGGQIPATPTAAPSGTDQQLASSSVQTSDELAQMQIRLLQELIVEVRKFPTQIQAFITQEDFNTAVDEKTDQDEIATSADI